MKIASSSVSMQASHAARQQWEIKESLRTWVGAQRREVETEAAQSARLAASAVTLSNTGSAAAQSTEANALQSSLDAANKDPILQLIRAVIAMLTGRDVRVFDASELAPAAAPTQVSPHPSSSTSTSSTPSQASGFGITYERSESYTETEQTRFAAQGSVRTSDGQQIDFSISLEMARSYHEESTTRLQIGDTQATQDPLMINFGGTAAQLSSQRFQFDLNADGQTENINFAGQGSGFLAIDRNGDGKINNGTELFGTQSGNGFADLAQLDSDHNGWIDENDAAYAQLRVWRKDADGKDQLSTLKQADVGALSLSRTATPYSLKDSNNDLQGQIRSSGIFLSESGQVGTLQQVDLTV